MRLIALLFSATAMLVAPAAVRADRMDVATESSQISVQTTGDVTFDIASDEVFDLHGDGTLHVTDHTGNTTRTLFAEDDDVIYKVNGVKKPFDEDAKDWLRGVIAQLPPPPPPPPT
jgi:hypothetical protein